MAMEGVKMEEEKEKERLKKGRGEFERKIEWRGM